MGNCFWLLLSCLVWSSLILGTHQLQSSQTQVLLQLRRQLEYPNQLEIWKDHTIDFCYLPSTPQVNLTCQDNFVSQLRITGEKTHKVENFIGFAVESQTLSANFSLDSFVATLARLTSLRVLSLVSLGIWGPLPDKIHRLDSLEYLDLSSNYLFGSVPPKISTMVELQTLVLDNNFLNDTVSDWFHSLSNLTILRLSNNKFKGKLPNLDSLNNLQVLDLSVNRLDSNLPSMPKGLIMLSLSNNSFSGEIPSQYSRLTRLQRLDMSFDGLTGTPPAALFAFPNISYLNLASNKLTGLPNHLSCSGKLQFVDISNNSLTGELPHCLNTDSNTRVVKFDGNCLSVKSNQRTESSCASISVPEKRNKSSGKGLAILVGAICGVIAFATLLVLGFFVAKRCCTSGTSEQHLLHKTVQDNSVAGLSSDILHNARFISQATKLGTQGVPICRSFTLEELKEATNNFDKANILGEGAYGPFYKGRLGDGSQVAIRCIPSSKKFTNRNLKLRLDLLAKLRHPNLVCLLGHCIDSGGQDGYNVNKVFLIYEYISNGNLRMHLCEDDPGKVLNWSERLAVLTSIAKAVQFLHTGVIPGFFNNRLKTNNILLNEHGIAKLSDYGLSIISEETGKPEEGGEGNRSWQMARLEDDVHSFGFIMLESLLVSSMSARRDAHLLDELASSNSTGGNKKLINPIVLATGSQESLSVVIGIANKCISESWNRPSFEDILWNLQYAAQIQETADGTKV